MSDTTADYLRDILHELDDITAFTQAGREAFEQDVKTRKAVVRSYEIIGEVATRIPEDVKTKNTDIDWRLLIGFRDFLVHNYDRVAAHFIWEAVEDVPHLRAAIESLLRSL